MVVILIFKWEGELASDDGPGQVMILAMDRGGVEAMMKRGSWLACKQNTQFINMDEEI